MLFWFVGLGVVVVWQVFRDTAIDYRLVMAGSLAPDVIDAVVGAGLVHTLASSAGLLAVVMVATRGRRRLRRRLLALPVGTFLHLVLDGAWTDTETFWWPAFGFDLGGGRLPSIERGPLNVVLELAGLAILVWAWRRFRLDEPARRRHLLRSGRLGRDLVS